MTTVRTVHFTDTCLPRRDGVITSVRTLVAAQRDAGWEPLTVVPRHLDQPAEEALHRLRAVPLGLADLRFSPWILRGAAAEGTGLPCVLAGPVLRGLGPLGRHGVLTGADPAGFGHAIARLLDQPAMAKAIGTASAERAGQHSPARYGQAISEVYHYAGARTGSFNIRGRTRR